ncbi:hypothetical protein ABZ579_30925, partial [Streptomyces thermolilacinus]
TNTRDRLKVEGLELAFTGLDDPHIKRDRYEKRRGPPGRAPLGRRGRPRGPGTRVRHGGPARRG